ncbi:MAG: hypothetical protein ACLTMP_13170 [Eggerthella lenta]
MGVRAPHLGYRIYSLEKDEITLEPSKRTALHPPVSYVTTGVKPGLRFTVG